MHALGLGYNEGLGRPCIYIHVCMASDVSCSGEGDFLPIRRCRVQTQSNWYLHVHNIHVTGKNVRQLSRVGFGFLGS